MFFLAGCENALITSINNRIEDIEERISCVKDTIEDIDTTVKENTKDQKLLTQNIQKIQDGMRKWNLRKIGKEESEDSNLKGQ